jgi:hypothetical protein
MLGERAVMRDDGDIQPQFERERARVAEAATRDEGDAHVPRARRVDGGAVAV